MKTPILGTGISGLVGSRIQELLSSEFDFTDLSFSTGIDITNYEQVLSAFENSPSSIVLHMAAKTDVDSCEDDKILGDEGQAWMVNVVGTQNIVDAAQKFGKRIIYISTDFVFDGTKEFYTEEDEVNPLNWYGVTKCEGEKLVEEAGINYTIIRLSYPYRASFGPKLDFVRKIVDTAIKKEKIIALTDHIFTPTFIDDLASALRLIMQKDLTGTYHLVGSQSLTPRSAVDLILNKFNLKSEIMEITREIYFKKRAFRPFKLALKNDKISKLGINMKSFHEGLDELKNQLDNI